MLYLILLLSVLQWTNGEDVDGRRGRKDPPSTPDWLASLEKKGKSVCAGALIHQKWVMASATCVERGVATVSLDNCGDRKKGDCKLRTSIANIIMHPTWWGGAMTDDIALIQLKKPFPAKRILKMSNRKVDKMLQEMKKQECYELDWTNGGKAADHLPVSISPDSACDRVFRTHPIKDPVCSVTRGGCPRDSTGNPTVCKIGKKTVLVGFAASSKKQGNECFTGLTRASRYHPWVRNTKQASDKTNVRTGDVCVPKSTGSPCADRGDICRPGPFSYRCCKPDGECDPRPSPGPPTEPRRNQALGDQCWTEASPSCVDENALCQNTNGEFTCQCKENYSVNDQNVCAVSSTTGRECTTASECGSYMVCQDGECQCRMGYADRGDGYCEYVGYGLEMPCLDDSTCADNNTFCLIESTTNRWCACKPEYSKPLASPVCEPCPDGQVANPAGGSIMCKDIIDYNGQCLFRQNTFACRGDLVCVQDETSSYKCLCPFGMKRVAGECVACPEGQGRSPVSEDQCIDITALDVDCPSGSLCPENAFCNLGSGVCTCAISYDTVRLDGKCYETSSHGGACGVDQLCKNNTNTICVDNMCVCKPGHTGIKDFCYPKSVCSNGAYPCAGWTASHECANATKCEIGTGVCTGAANKHGLDQYCNMPYGFLCLANYMCDVTLGLVCSDRNYCECQAGMEWQDSTCRPL